MDKTRRCRVRKRRRNKEQARTHARALSPARPTTSTQSHLDDGPTTMAMTLFLAPGAQYVV